MTMPHRAARPRAFTLDLDDTLWPIAPTLQRAEAVLRDWLARHAPATQAWCGEAGMLRLRAQVWREHPELAHDLSTLRLLTIRRALQAAGDDVALAEPAFEVFLAARQQVTWFDDVAPALERLAARGPLLALSNGNADLAATGLTRWFVGGVSARGVGVAKPDARIFAAACARLGCAPQEVMHIGDDWRLDIVGARRAGLHSAWLRRPGLAHTPGPAQALQDDGADLPTGGHHLELPDLLALVEWVEGG
ncbi:MAG: HAD family hydrolase [Burkholderiaceae bacterium]|nr:HAD family hydrolase [Burkholderiaceae bacterium]